MTLREQALKNLKKNTPEMGSGISGSEYDDMHADVKAERKEMRASEGMKMEKSKKKKPLKKKEISDPIYDEMHSDVRRERREMKLAETFRDKMRKKKKDAISGAVKAERRK